MKLWLNRIAATVIFFIASIIIYQSYHDSSTRLEREEKKELSLLNELESKIHRAQNLQGYRQQLNKIEQQLNSNLAIISFFKSPKDSLDWCVAIEKLLLNGINCQLDELIESEFYKQQNILFEFRGSLTDVNQFLEIFSSHPEFIYSPISINAFSIEAIKTEQLFAFSGTLAVYVENPYEE